MSRCFVIPFLLSLGLLGCMEFQDRNSYYQLHNEGPPFTLKVMTFNILSSLDLLSVSQGYPVWGQRRAALIGFIQDIDAEIVGLQEASYTQAEQLSNSLADRYEFVSNAAYSTDTLLLVRKGKLTILEQGYWLLEKPTAFRTIRRLALWAKIRHEESGREFLAVAVHIDANEKSKAQEVGRLIDKLQKEQQSSAPLFFFGDFNMAPHDLPFRRFLIAGWQDSFLGIEEVLTFPVRNLQRRIDHVLFHGKGVNPIIWEAKDYAADEVLLSDHRPVIVRFHILGAL